MTQVQILNQANIANLPWEDRPAGSTEPLWRYSKNPVIPRDLIPGSNSIFNSAVVPFNGSFAGVFRCDDRSRRMLLHRGFSADGLELEARSRADQLRVRRAWRSPSSSTATTRASCWIEDRYYVTWCNGYHGPTIGVGWTKDFKTFHQLENAFLPVQPQRRALPAQDQRQVRHAQPRPATTVTPRSATSTTARAPT